MCLDSSQANHLFYAYSDDEQVITHNEKIEGLLACVYSRCCTYIEIGRVEYNILSHDQCNIRLEKGGQSLCGSPTGSRGDSTRR